MIDIFKKQILRLLTHGDYKPVKVGALAKSVGVGKDDYAEFKKAFEQLRKEGRVIIGSKSLVTLPAISGRIYGVFRANPKGFGFVIPTEANAHGDLFIGPEDTAGAMTGDKVIAKVAKKTSRLGQTRLSGKVVEILERANNRFVGVVIKKGSQHFLRPDGNTLSELIELDDIGAKGASVGDKVVVEILSFPTASILGRGVIIEVLGKPGVYTTELKATIRQFQLVEVFEADCLTQASEAAKNFKPETAKGRLDITDKMIVTIDPPDAKDFDDAISIDKNSDGNFVLGVHIADVCAFVEADSPLDIEAGKRGNSVYLPLQVLPMLPEVLSNGICSLQPGQKRFAKSAFITYDLAGKVLKTEFANSIIKSKARLTYQQADKILKGGKTELADDVVSLLKDMEKLSRIIEARRRDAGMLHLDLPETELLFDKAGRVIDAVLADDSYPHTIIEMFMVEANEAVASAIRAVKVPLMRRIHPDPDALSFKTLTQTLKILGFNVGKTIDRFALQLLLDKVKDTPASFAVNTYVLRSLSRAEYSPLNIGHYALASKDYGHFTSPIRRYADLLVHRVLDMYIKGGGKVRADKVKTSDELAEIGKHITFTERRAAEAEDDLKKVLILNMLKDRIGSVIETTVSGLTNFGIFVRCRKFGIEGLIPLEILGGDVFKYDHKAQCVYGDRTGVTIQMGRKLKAKIISVNIAARQLNLAPAEPLVSVKERKKSQKKQRNLKTKKRNLRRMKNRRSR